MTPASRFDERGDRHGEPRCRIRFAAPGVEESKRTCAEPGGLILAAFEIEHDRQGRGGTGVHDRPVADLVLEQRLVQGVDRARIAGEVSVDAQCKACECSPWAAGEEGEGMGTHRDEISSWTWFECSLKCLRLQDELVTQPNRRVVSAVNLTSGQT